MSKVCITIPAWKVQTMSQEQWEEMLSAWIEMYADCYFYFWEQDPKTLDFTQCIDAQVKASTRLKLEE